MKATSPFSRNRASDIGIRICLSSFVVLWAALLSAADDLGQWQKSETIIARTKLLKNVLSDGAVVASPSTQNPNYFYHWVRDAAVSMNVVLDLYSQAADQIDRDNYFDYLTTYVDFCRSNQTTPNTNPQAQPDRQIGEPKYLLDGSADTENWGRPQDDGPALRALVLIRLANMLLDGGQPAQAAYVKSKLYDGTLPTASVIKADLEYVSHNWQNSCFDLWEETGGRHFYTRIVQHRALLAGAKLAVRLNDGGAAVWYNAQAAALEPAIAQHWDQGRGYLVATLEQERPNFVTF
jgi:glucoamylase